MEINTSVEIIFENKPSRNKTVMSPLRYPGSKRRLVDYIKESLRINNFQPSLYVEPFVGGRIGHLRRITASLRWGSRWKNGRRQDWILQSNLKI